MLPELFIADAMGAVGKPLMRVHTAGSVGGSTANVAMSLIHARHPRARAHDRLGEAVGEQRDVGALALAAVLAAAGGGRRRLFRTADPRLHRALGRTRRHRHPHRAEGPAQRAEESLRAPPDPRHRPSKGRATRRCSGTRSATSRRCPSSDGACAMVLASESARRTRADAAGLGARHRDAQRARRCSPVATRSTRGRTGVCDATSTARARITDPRKEIDCRGDLRPVLAGSRRCGWRTSTSRRRVRGGR